MVIRVEADLLSTAVKAGVHHDSLSCAHLKNTHAYTLYHDLNNTNSYSLIRNMVSVLKKVK